MRSWIWLALLTAAAAIFIVLGVAHICDRSSCL